MTFPVLVASVLATTTVAGVLARVTQRYLSTTIAASAAILLLQHVYFHYTSDDAYISYRYARNLADGVGVVWNPGENVEGYTNFLWVAILAALHRLGADIVVSGRWLGFTLAIVAAAGTYRLTADLLEGEAGRVAGVVAALLLASSGAWALWTTAGLEAPLFATLMLSAILLHLRERPREASGPSRGWLPASGMVWGFVALARPEGVLLFAISGAFKLGDAVAHYRSAAPHGILHRSFAAIRIGGTLLAWAIGFALIFVPYFVWRFDTFGWLFPNTFYAKIGSGLDQYDRGLRYLTSFLQQYGGWLLLLVPVTLAVAAGRRGPMLYVLSLLLSWLAYVALVGGDSLLLFRFLAPILPVFFALIVASTGTLLMMICTEQPLSKRVASAAFAVVVLSAIAFTLYPTANQSDRIRGERSAVHDRGVIGRWMRDALPATTTVAAVPVGAIAYESRLVTIDMLGITDEHIAHRDLPLGEFPAGHEKYDTEYVLDRQPDIIILFDGLSSEPWTSADYDTLRHVFILAVADMIGNERTSAEYERRAVDVGEGMWFNLLVRRGATAVMAKTDLAPP